MRCTAAAAGGACSAVHRRAIRAIIGRIRRAGISSSISGSGTRKAIPDEDFAETFAVWLTPRSNWRKRYEGWPALKKLQYVDELMAEIARQKPMLTRRIEVEPLR